MRRSRMIPLFITLLFIMSLFGCSTVDATYPNRDVTVIIPFNAGGGIDISGRALFTQMDELYNGIKFVPTNVTGASGTIGASELYYADNDGYTVMVAGNGMNVAHVANDYELAFNDFELVSQYVVSQPGLFVRSDSPYTTYEEFIAAAAEKPDSIKMGVVTGTINHYAVMALQANTDATFQQIIIGGDQPQQPELLSGRVDAYVTAVSQNTAYLESGDFRCLGVFADERLESLPEVPTFAELGIEDDYQLSFGVWAPSGTPEEVIAKLSTGIETACSDPAFVENMATLGYTVEYLDTAAYTESMDQSLTNIIALTELMGLDNSASLDPYNTPYTVPVALIIAIVVLGLLEIGRKLYQKEPFNPKFLSLFKGNVIPFAGSLFAFAFLFEIIGYTVATTLYLTIMILYLRKKVIAETSVQLVVKTAGASAAFAILSFLFFTQVAGIMIPSSPLGIL